MATLATTIGVTPILLQQSVYAPGNPRLRHLPLPGITSTWRGGLTRLEMMKYYSRASSDKGQTFGDKINLSNTPDAGSERVEIDSDGDSVVVTWWETNQTDDTPVMRVSDDNGKTFGPLLKLATNGTLGGE